MDTITTIRDLLKLNGSAQHVTVALTPSEIRLIAAAPDMHAEIASLRAELAQEREWKREGNRLYRAINGMDIDDFDKRAEYVVQTSLDGLSIGPTNRCSVRALLAEHFADIASAAARQDAKTIARLREALQRIERESVDDVSRADARAALRFATEKDEPT